MYRPLALIQKSFASMSRFAIGGSAGSPTFALLVAESSSLCGLGSDIVPIHKRHRKSCVISLTVRLILMAGGVGETGPGIVGAHLHAEDT
jgi:hypothetical protein